MRLSESQFIDELLNRVKISILICGHVIKRCNKAFIFILVLTKPQ